MTDGSPWAQTGTRSPRVGWQRAVRERPSCACAEAARLRAHPSRWLHAFRCCIAIGVESARAAELILHGYSEVGNEQRRRCDHLNDDEIHDESFLLFQAHSVRIAGDGSMTAVTFFRRGGRDRRTVLLHGDVVRCSSEAENGRCCAASGVHPSDQRRDVGQGGG